MYTPLLRTIDDPPIHPCLSVLGKILTTVIPVTSVVLGILYLESCPRQYMIPVYLIVSGGMYLLFLGCSCFLNVCWSENDQGYKYRWGCRSFPLLLQLVWFIAGNVWIYSIFQPDYEDTSSKNYCHKVLYLYAFWTTTIVYILIGLMLLIGCCVATCVIALRSSLPDGPRNDRYP